MPVIGITSTNRLESDDNYITAIEDFKGKPRNFAAQDSSIRTHLASISEYLSHIDGLLLTGGGDINPSVYFQERHFSIGGVSRSRDALEIGLFQKALEADMPVFGICRGIQIMSVAMGGSLHQHIPDIPNLPQALPHKIAGDDSRHDIEITEGSLLRDLIGEPFAEVNSAHHQAVDVVGEGFVVTARSTADGIIEAIEHPDKRFMLGVQYHPERMLNKPGRMFNKPEMDEHAKQLFKAFIAAAS